MSPSSQRTAARGIDVLPKLAAWIECIDPNLAERADSRENIRIRISRVRGTEHVKHVGQSSLELSIFRRLECVRQQHQPGLAMLQPVLAHAAVRIEYQLPQMPLPSLGLAHRVNLGPPRCAPSRDHAPPGNRILTKKP